MKSIYNVSKLHVLHTCFFHCEIYLHDIWLRHSLVSVRDCNQHPHALCSREMIDRHQSIPAVSELILPRTFSQEIPHERPACNYINIIFRKGEKDAIARHSQLINAIP